jgi:glycerol-3-phosphate dehydrogenase
VKKADKILVLGAGNFGTCLAQQLARNEHSVLIWDRSEEVVDSINNYQKNSKYLTEFDLHSNIKAVSDLSKLDFSAIKACVLCIPVQAIREVLTQRVPDGSLEGKILVCASKGLEISSGMLPYKVIEECLGEEIAKNTCILSGPSFAVEVMHQFPTAVSCSAVNEKAALFTQEMFHSPHFRVYTNSNPVGLELAGAMKNVIAIAAGASSGLGFQSNTLVAIITRGLAEIIRIGASLGIDSKVFIGLGGVGDLMLTCTSEKSRNFTVGFKMGQGMSFDETMESMSSVAEGVYTTKAAKAMVDKNKIDAPITNAVYKVIYEGIPVKEAMTELLKRDAKSETDQ